jgi:hypothetical protein
VGLVAVLGAGLACSPAPRKVDPEALVKKMSDRLAAARTISFTTTEMHERRKGEGKREVHFSRRHLIQRPDRAAFAVTGSERDASGVYDGDHLTLVWPGEKAFARVKMPATIDATLDRMADHFKIPMPVGDLLYSNPYERLMGGRKGTHAGRESIGGKECERLSYDEDRVAWQIWIAASGDPLPCQIEITTKGRSGPLTSRVTFADWNLAAPVPEGAFVAKVPDGYERILMVPRAPEAPEASAAAAPAPEEKKE